MSFKRNNLIKRRVAFVFAAVTGVFVVATRLNAARPIVADVPPQTTPDLQKAADDVASAVTGRATPLQNTWSFELQEGGKALSHGLLGVRGRKWVLAVTKTPTTGPSTQPNSQPIVLFYGDQHYIYNLRSLQRYGYQGVNSLPNATLIRVLLANVEPSAVISTFGLPVSKAEESAVDGSPLLRLRFELPSPKSEGGALIIRSSTPATDVLYDTVNKMIVGIRDVELRSGAGVVCYWKLQKDVSLPSVISTIEVQEDGKGQFNRVPEDRALPALRLTSFNTPDRSALFAQAEAQIQSAGFFATPTESLGNFEETRQAANANPSDLTDAVAVAESMFVTGDLSGGFSGWSALDKKLTDAALRHRLVDILAPLAAEASSSALGKPSGKLSVKTEDLIANILEKLSSATDAGQWHQVSGEVITPWLALRQQQTLSDSNRQQLDHDILPRLCSSGNVSVYAALLRLSHSDPALQPLINSNLDAAAAQRLPTQGYAGSSLSAQVAAAILADDLGRATRWLDGANWSEEKSSASKLPRDAVRIALSEVATFKAGQDLGALIVASSRLSDKDLAGDPSASAARTRLLQIGGSVAMQSETDCVAPTATLDQASVYWESALALQCRPSMQGSTMQMDEVLILRLASRYATAFKKPAAVSKTLVMLSDRDRFGTGLLAMRRQRLNAALAAAPDDATRLFVVRHIVDLFKQLREPDQAMAAVSSLLSKVQDPLSLQQAKQLAKDVQRWQDQVSRRQVHQQTVIDNAGAAARLELASHANLLH